MAQLAAARRIFLRGTPITTGIAILIGVFVEMFAPRVAILATLIAFIQLEPLAGTPLAPQPNWVSFAAFLTGTLRRMNP